MRYLFIAALILFIPACSNRATTEGPQNGQHIQFKKYSTKSTTLYYPANFYSADYRAYDQSSQAWWNR